VPLKSLHPDESVRSWSSYEYWSKQRTEDIVDSLRPGEIEPLTTRPDGTIRQGHTRILVLRERGYDVDALPRIVDERMDQEFFYDLD
jgi:hypothetical protein